MQQSHRVRVPSKRKAATPKTPKPLRPTSQARVQAVLASLKRLGTKSTRDSMARYGIVGQGAEKSFGVPVGKIQALAKRLIESAGGRDHDLAAALWETGWYEARMLAAFIDDPARVTPAQMNRWAKDFDNWGICDTVCFHLFDKSPHAFAMIPRWAAKREEFVRRAGYALLASLALHDKSSGDEPFARCLPLFEQWGADADGRNFVKKGVSWALRGIGHRSPALHAAAIALAQRLAAAPDPAARWVGKDALKDLTRPAVARRIAAKRSAHPK